ncbi:hypothetical protein KFL_007200010 [Klebsormidium nitens]|uniref:Serine/threonine-protein phosphatase 4 regulatory subunit 2 n=1 Tax=Klebsormidium nitens TaxID=105231 RepID=A0A1Y1ILN0_KLENI|nr:hypothetical protein KFL_007200010 [Klebsormidium nitens]|eukprot:GAQ91052.1 hypothetical protein KFL_007200010 [Klebsormidium nitens]
MDSVLETYNKSRLAVDVGPPRPLLGGESFEGLQGRLHALLDAITGPPFTIQRLCEVLLWPHETYTSIDKLALALEKLLMVTQTIPLSSDAYPPLPLPPHQPPPPRRPNPQPMQPRLSFGHQPHPEANPDQIEEHELNLHQNHQLHPHGGNHRGAEAETGGKAVPSFLEADGTHREGPGDPPGHLAKYFDGAGGERRPAFHGASGPLLEMGTTEGARKRSFEESLGQGEVFPGQAEAIEAVREGGFHVAHRAVLGDDVSRALAETGSLPSNAREPSDFEARPTGPHGNAVVSMDEESPVDVVALPAADVFAALPEPSIEPMTPPAIKDVLRVRSTVEMAVVNVDRSSKEGLVQEEVSQPVDSHEASANRATSEMDGTIEHTGS